MLEFRSPLLIFHLLAWAGLAAFGAGWVEVFWSGQLDIDPWRQAPSVIPDVVRLGFWGFLGVSLILLGMEIALARGWEPRWLETTWVGVTVREKFNEGSKLVIGVRGRDVNADFYCDQGEYDGVEVGDVIHLRSIGKYVADYRKVEKQLVDPTSCRWVHRGFPSLPNLIVLGLIVLVVGCLLWFGFYGLATGEMAWRTSGFRRGRSVPIVTTRFNGLPLILSSVGAILLGSGALIWLWRKLREGADWVEHINWVEVMSTRVQRW